MFVLPEANPRGESNPSFHHDSLMDMNMFARSTHSNEMGYMPNEASSQQQQHEHRWASFDDETITLGCFCFFSSDVLHCRHDTHCSNDCTRSQCND